MRVKLALAALVLAAMCVGVAIADDDDDGFVSPGARSAMPAGAHETDEPEPSDAALKMKAKLAAKAAAAEAPVRAWKMPVQDSYWIEGALCAFLVVYVVNYFVGKRRNRQVAQAWLARNREFLTSRFTRLGSGEPELTLVEEHYHRYSLYATGSPRARSLRLSLQLAARHDLLSVLYALAFPEPETVSLDATLFVGSVERFVFGLVPRRDVSAARRRWSDLDSFGAQLAASTINGVPDSLAVLTDAAEVAEFLVSGDVTRALAAHAAGLVHLHVSDRSPSASVPGAPMVHATVRLASAGDSASELTERLLTAMVLHVVDKLPSVRITVRAAEKVARLRETADAKVSKAQAEALREQAAERRAERLREESARKLAAIAKLSPKEQRAAEEREMRAEEKRRMKKMRKVVRM